MPAHSLHSVPDDTLLERLSDLLRQSRRCEAELVAHIAEVDARKLYAREAAPSMFAYCVARLHLSGAEAYLRIAAARASREHPQLLEMLADGRLHLCAVGKLAPHLTRENAAALLARAVHKTKRQVQELIAEIAPRPDAPTLVRKLPWPPATTRSQPGHGADRAVSSLHALPAHEGSPAHASAGHGIAAATHGGARAAQHSDSEGAELEVLASGTASPRADLDGPSPATHAHRELRPDAVAVLVGRSIVPDPQIDAAELRLAPVGQSPTPPARSKGQIGAASSAGRDVVAPLSIDRYKVQFTASASLKNKLERLQALMPSQVSEGGLAAVIEAAVTEKLERLEARRFALTHKPRRTLAQSPTAPISRQVPAAVRRAVYERDGGRCHFLDGKGRRCPETVRLEFHHRHPFGHGGDHGPTNLSLMCRAHNELMAEVDYGSAWTRSREPRGS